MINKKIIAGIGIVAAAAISIITPALAAGTVVITSNTSTAENQPGWMFNRDASTDTPYNFNNDAHSIGSGSLYVLPIGATAADKFIAENFVNTPITNVNSISYDFKIGSGGAATAEEHFYMNVYANFGVSDDLKFYDCRYDVIPNIGSISGFTTVTFDPTQSYPVTTRTGGSASPFTCPTVPADMNNLSAGSNIRMFSISVGDTSASDQGLDGYLDNVVVNLGTTGVTTYDFEKISAPTIQTPADNATVTTAAMTEVDWSDVEGSSPIQYQYEAHSNATYTGLIYSSGWLSDSEIPTPNTPPGEYYLRVRARDVNEVTSEWSNDASDPHKVTVTADPTPTTTITSTPTPTTDPFAIPEACSEIAGLGSPIKGTNGNNTINGTSGNDLIFAMGGNDTINGNGGDDCIVAEGGNDRINGGNGNDVGLGGAGNDQFNGGNGNDKFYGDGGNDTANGGNDNDELWGEGGNDVLDGGNGMDKAYGGTGNDSLRGGNQSDTLIGDEGNDTAQGGAASDTCVAEAESSCELNPTIGS